MRAFYTSAFLLTLAVVAQGQGTVLFRNFDAATGFRAPMFNHDDTPLSGTSYTAELLAGPSASSLMTIATTSFLSGAQAGYFDGGVQSIPQVPSGSIAFLEIRLWLTLSGSFAACLAADLVDTWQVSPLFQVTVGGQDSPALLTPLPALWIQAMDVPPLNPKLYVNFNRVDNTAVVSWEGIGLGLEVSTNLVQWTNFVGSSPHAFPLTQGPMFFRSKRPL